MSIGEIAILSVLLVNLFLTIWVFIRTAHTQIEVGIMFKRMHDKPPWYVNP